MNRDCVTFHFVHWDPTDCRGNEPEPHICSECQGSAHISRWSLESVHASVRMLAKEGTGFRDFVEDFVCLSPGLAVSYDLQRFHGYNVARKKKVLTESNILGMLLAARKGLEDPAEAGLTLEELEGDGLTGALGWLQSYAAKARAAALRLGGLAALAVVRPKGVEISAFGTATSYFAKRPNPPILQVIFLMSGPDGLDVKMLRSFEKALMAGPPGESGGCHLGPFHLTASQQVRPHAALGSLLMCHDRRALIPLLEDLRCVGENKYQEWVRELRSALLSFGLGGLDFEKKLRALEAFSNAPPAPPTLGVAKKRCRVPTTPASVEVVITGVVRDGLLPQGPRPWRARQCIEAVEPEKLLEALQRLRSGASAQRWEDLSEQLERQASIVPPVQNSTPRGVRLATAKADERLGRQEGKSLRRWLPALWQLPCATAVGLLSELCARRREAAAAGDLWLLAAASRLGADCSGLKPARPKRRREEPDEVAPAAKAMPKKLRAALAGSEPPAESVDVSLDEL